MKLSEEEIKQKHARQRDHCNPVTLLPYEYVWRCISCGFKIMNRKQEITKTQRKRINFINRLKYAEQKVFCIFIDVYKINKGDIYDKIYEVLSTLKNKELKLNNILSEKIEDMSDYPDFEQDYYSRTAVGI